jgi:hypothetical protein
VFAAAMGPAGEFGEGPGTTRFRGHRGSPRPPRVGWI